MKKVLRYFLIFLSVIIGLLILALFLIGPIAKYEINKNCQEWIGRNVSIGSITLNPFNGSVSIKDIKVYEQQGDSSFFNCNRIYLQVNLKKLLNKFYEVDKMELDAPEIRLFQNGSKFSFDDLIKRFSSNKPKPKDTTQLHYDISNVSITNGTIIYNNVPIHNSYKIYNLNVSLPQVSWDKPESNLHIDFKSGDKGSFDINLAANLKTFNYNLTLLVDNYDLSQYTAPLNTFIKISSLQGTLGTRLNLHGKFNSPEDFSFSCNLDIKELEVKGRDKRKLFALGELAVTVDSMNVKHNLFDFSKILLDRPYVALDVFPNGSNISRALTHQKLKEERDTVTGKVKHDYSNALALLASSIKGSAINFLGANYQADNVSIHNGEFVFNDFTPHHEFHSSVSGINVSTDEIESKNRRVYFRASAVLDDTGKFSMKASFGYNFIKKVFSYNIDKLDIPDISPVAKYVLEKNSVKWTGRRITTGMIKVRPLKGSIDIRDITVYEPDSTNVFFACHNMYIRVNLKQMTDNVYQVDRIRIDNPEISIIQNGNSFNFDDIVRHFSSPTSPSDTTTQPEPKASLHYDIKDVSINDGSITFNNQPIHNIFKIHELNVDLPEIRWDNPESKAHVDFNYGIGGFISVDLDADRSTSKYTMSLDVEHYDLSQYYAPLNTFLRISSLKGELNTKLRIHGKFNRPNHISGTGYIHINDLEIADTANNKVFALGQLALNIDTVNVEHGMFYLNNIVLNKPYLLFNYYSNGNNISQMIRYGTSTGPVQDNTTGEIKPDYSNIFTLIASSVKMMSVNMVNSNYHTDSIIISNGQFLYNDYSLNVPFHYNISDLNIATDRISAAKKTLRFNLFAKLEDTGKFKMDANISLDLKNMLLNYDLTGLRLADFNPYTEYYIGTTFLSGTMRYHSTDSVVNRNLKSTNLIHIDGVSIGEKPPGKPVYDIPVRMAVSLLKDGKDNIYLDIPASGNLDDPNYKIGPLVGRITKELVVKTATSPFKALGKLFNRKPEDMDHLSFDYLEDKLPDKEGDKIELIYKVLNKKKELVVEITQVTDSIEEKDEMALDMAKRQYYQETNHLVKDSLLNRKGRRKELKAEDRIATQDTLFGKYLNQKLHLTGNELMSVEDKCIRLIGDSVLTKKVHDFMINRNQEIIDYLIHKKLLPSSRVKVQICKDSTIIQNMGEPEFEIKYNTD